MLRSPKVTDPITTMFPSLYSINQYNISSMTSYIVLFKSVKFYFFTDEGFLTFEMGILFIGQFVVSSELKRKETRTIHHKTVQGLSFNYSTTTNVQEKIKSVQPKTTFKVLFKGHIYIVQGTFSYFFKTKLCLIRTRKKCMLKFNFFWRLSR